MQTQIYYPCLFITDQFKSNQISYLFPKLDIVNNDRYLVKKKYQTQFNLGKLSWDKLILNPSIRHTENCFGL